MRSVIGHASSMCVVDGRVFVKDIDAGRRERLVESYYTHDLYCNVASCVLAWGGASVDLCGRSYCCRCVWVSCVGRMLFIV